MARLCAAAAGGVANMTDAIALLVEALDDAFDRKAWHGTNLRGAIRGLTADAAAWRPAPGRHNIWEIVVHAAYWKYAVRRRLLGEKRGRFAIEGSNWFERPAAAAAPDAQWKADVALLVGTHASLRTAVAQLSAADLSRRAAGGETTVRALVTGIAAHDLYHAGQVQLLKRLHGGKPRARFAALARSRQSRRGGRSARRP